MTEDLLSIWENEAQKFYDGNYVDLSRKALAYRNLKLISLIRKQRETLEEIAFSNNGDDGIIIGSLEMSKLAKKALALELEDI